MSAPDFYEDDEPLEKIEAAFERGELALTWPIPPMHVRLDLPYLRPPEPLSQNWRGHWSPRARAVRQVRETVTVLARQAGLHRLTGVGHVAVRLCWAPGDRRRRDGPNYAPMVKAAVDALARGPRRDLVGIDLVPDDTQVYVTELPTRILPPPAKRGMWIDLWIYLNDPDGEEP